MRKRWPNAYTLGTEGEKRLDLVVVGVMMMMEPLLTHNVALLHLIGYIQINVFGYAVRGYGVNVTEASLKHAIEKVSLVSIFGGSINL